MSVTRDTLEAVAYAELCYHGNSAPCHVACVCGHGCCSHGPEDRGRCLVRRCDCKGYREQQVAESDGRSFALPV